VATIGYGRTSTTDQKAGLDAQQRDLKAAGCEKLFIEHASGKDIARPQLAAAMDYMREGDTFVVTKLDRLARSVADLMTIVEKLTARSIQFRILAMDLDTAKPTGKLMLGVLGSVAQFEREMMLERQRDGIAAGRAPTVRMHAAEIARLHDEGLSNGEIAKRLGVHRTNVGRVLAKAAMVRRVLAEPEAAD
jgi:DNA invertase Pin-like site-specific DNA recombinase